MWRKKADDYLWNRPSLWSYFQEIVIHYSLIRKIGNTGINCLYYPGVFYPDFMIIKH